MSKSNRHSTFCVYMIEDKFGLYYTGYTRDVAKRFEAHQKGRGAKFLRGRRPLKLVFTKEYRYYKHAIVAERRIKTFTRDRKQKMILEFAKAQIRSKIERSCSC